MGIKSESDQDQQAPRISVCMATHNGAIFLKEQLDSILDQLGADDQLLISDDASTDATVAILDRLQQQDTRVVFLGSRRFGSPTLNFEHVLQQATGKFIFLADQDDVWMPDKVVTLLPLLEQYDVVLTDCQLINQYGALLRPSFFALRESRPGFGHNLLRNAYMGCCMAFRRDVLRYTLPFPAHIHMHDWWIGLMAEMRGKVYFLPKPLVRYRRHEANASPTGKSTYSAWRQLKNRFWMSWAVVRRLLYTN